MFAELNEMPILFFKYTKLQRKVLQIDTHTYEWTISFFKSMYKTRNVNTVN